MKIVVCHTGWNVMPKMMKLEIIAEGYWCVSFIVYPCVLYDCSFDECVYQSLQTIQAVNFTSTSWFAFSAIKILKQSQYRTLGVGKLPNSLLQS